MASQKIVLVAIMAIAVLGYVSIVAEAAAQSAPASGGAAEAPAKSGDVATAAGLSPTEGVASTNTDDIASAMGPSIAGGEAMGPSAAGPSANGKSASSTLKASAVVAGVSFATRLFFF